MRPTPVPRRAAARLALLAAAATLLLSAALPAPARAVPVPVLGPGGEVTVREDPIPGWAAMPAPAAAVPRAERSSPRPAAGAAARRRTWASELRRLRRARRITAAEERGARRTLAAAKRALRRLDGVRAAELAGAIRNAEDLARRRRLTPSLLRPVLLTLDRNRRWWTTGPVVAPGARVAFRGSELVWQRYAGEGLQLQWTGTFGKANALHEINAKDRLRALLAEATALATERAGGLAWEFLFDFGRGAPPWVSSLAQGTALQALARGTRRLRDTSYLETGRRALGVFRERAPRGVRLVRPAGDHFLLYSFDRRLRVLNAYVQALVGLHTFADVGRDAEAQRLFERGDRQARRETPLYDTGAWSLYAIGDRERESDLGYHRLVRDFLRRLCQRTSTPVYCATEDAFTRYLAEDPVVALVTRTTRAGREGALRVRLSKVSTVRLTVRRGTREVVSRELRLGRGTGRVPFTAPGRPGVYDVVLTAVDLAGNRARAEAELRVLEADADDDER